MPEHHKKVESQIDNYREIAKELVCDESEEVFEKRLSALTKKSEQSDKET